MSLESFQRDMGMTPESKSTVSSNSASLLQAGGEYILIFPNLPPSLTQPSLFRLLLRLALYRTIRSTMVHCSSLVRLQHWCDPSALLSKQLGRDLVRRTRHLGPWCGHRDSHHPHVQRRDGTQGYSWPARQHVSVLLHPRCFYELLDRLCRCRAHAFYYSAVESSCWTATCSWWYSRHGNASYKRELPLVGQGWET